MPLPSYSISLLCVCVCVCVKSDVYQFVESNSCPMSVYRNHLQQEEEGLPEVHMPVFVSTNSIVSDEP